MMLPTLDTRQLSDLRPDEPVVLLTAGGGPVIRLAPITYLPTTLRELAQALKPLLVEEDMRVELQTNQDSAGKAIRTRRSEPERD